MLILNKDLLAWPKLVLRLVVSALLGRLGDVWPSLLDALRPDGVDLSPLRLCLDSRVQVGVGLLIDSFLVARLLLDTFRVARLLLDTFWKGPLLTFVNFDRLSNNQAPSNGFSNDISSYWLVIDRVLQK